MFKNKVLQLISFLAIAMVLLISGCEKEKPRKITVGIALLPAEEEQYFKIAENFTEKTGIEVEIVAQQYSQIQQIVEAEGRAGQGEFDVFEFDVYLLPLMRRFMLPLDTLLESPNELRATIDSEVLSAATFTSENELYYVPHRLNWQAMFWDVEKLDAPPTNWEELLQVAKDHPGEIGFKGARYEGLVCDVFPFIWQAGGDVLHPNSIESRRAIEFLVELSEYFNTDVQSYKENSILQAQEHKEIVLHYNWPFAAALLKQNGMLGDQIKTAPLPAGPEGMATVLGGGYLGVPITAPNPKLGAKFLDYVTSVKTQQALVKNLGWFPIREGGWEAMSDSDRTVYAGFLEMRDHVRSRPNIERYPQISHVWQQGLYKILFNDQPADKVLVEMQFSVDSIIAAE